MKIGILGELTRFEELKQTLPAAAEIFYHNMTIPETLDDYDVFFDLNFEQHQVALERYLLSQSDTIFILSSVGLELKSLQNTLRLKDSIFGMNCLPTFIHRSVKEISYHNDNQKFRIQILEEMLHWKIAPVKDRVGMVTSRILCMIINEAYYTLQEGIASKADIDTGMKLGTNYPFGPFEWCEKLGVKTVVTMLEKIYNDTKDERYKICPLLKSASY